MGEREAGGDTGEGVLFAQPLGAESLPEQAHEARDARRSSRAEQHIDLIWFHA